MINNNNMQKWMEKKTLKSKLMNHEQSYGSWLTLAHPLIPEILTPAGFDWLTIDY